MKKFLFILWMMLLTSTIFANPNVTLQTSSLGYPYTKTFQVNVTFSEPVTGFSACDINIINASIVSITDNCNLTNYVMTIQPTAAGNVSLFIPANTVTSLSTGAPNFISKTLNITALDPTLRPSSNFDLTKWSLTLPLGSLYNAISIGQTTLNGIPAANTGYAKPPYFFTDPLTGAMRFFSPLNGGTTPNSTFSRCELTEILPGSSPTWKLSTFASNTLTASLLVTQIPPVTKRMVIGQIHDKGDTDSYGHSASNSPLVKLYYDMDALDPNNNPCNGCVYAQVRITPSQGNYLKVVNLISNIPLNTLFTYKITLLRDGTLTIKANNTSTTILLNTSSNNTLGWGAQNLYFKAGVYNVESATSSLMGGAAGFYSLQVSHA